MNGTLIFALLSLLATLTYLATFSALHVLRTGYDPARDAVSDYAIGRYGYLFRIGLWTSSLGVLALGFALMAGLGSPPLGTRAPLYLLLIPVTRIGMTLSPTDLGGTHLSGTRIVHYVFAILAFTFTYLVISETTPVLRDLDPAQWLQGTLKWLAWAVATELFLVVVTIYGPLRRVFGLFERLFLLTTSWWQCC
jgi:Protein of unknown function (DUF998)